MMKLVPAMHQRFIDNALETLKGDARIAGVAAGGSYIYNDMDEYSDIDFVIAVDPGYFGQVMEERRIIAQRLGPLLAAFTGEHVGEPRLLVCLYWPPLLHVDLKFVSLGDVGHRAEDPVILWERDGAISQRLRQSEAKFPLPDPQWIEDRFWAWVHYIAAKIGRGELFEAIESISFLRQNVTGPLALLSSKKLPRGVRKLETDALAFLPAFKETVAGHDAVSCINALRAVIRLYTELRDSAADGAPERRTEAEKYSKEYLDGIEERCGGDRRF
jgi:predicted nucleotidyltransferase